MCVRSLSLSHGVARGGKVAFEISDKKPLCLSCANSKDEMWWNKRERVGSNLNLIVFWTTLSRVVVKDFCFFFVFVSFLFAQNCKIQLHSKHTNTQSAHYEYTPQIVSRKWVTLFNDDDVKAMMMTIRWLGQRSHRRGRRGNGNGMTNIIIISGG